MMQVGGIDLTRHLASELQRPELRLDVAREIKEKYAVVAPGSESSSDPGPTAQYELPDGTYSSEWSSASFHTNNE